MKKAGKSLAFCMVLVITLTLAGTARINAQSPALPAADVPKEEVVYANLSTDGSVNEIYVVNLFHVPEAGTITDYGAYSTVKNLTGTEKPIQNGDQITVEAPTGIFYYQGNLVSRELPWDISVSYSMDGIEMPAEQIAGQSGHLEISIRNSPNPNVNASFFENYMLQISVKLDLAKCGNIIAKGGTPANAGRNKQITYTVMPGKSASFILSADVEDFSMDSIELTAVPYSIQIDISDIGDMTEGLSALPEAVDELGGGIGKIRDGAESLQNGAAELKNGSEAFGAGLASLRSNSEGLVGGSREIKSALDTMSASLGAVSSGTGTGSLAELPPALMQMASSLQELSSALNELSTGFSSAHKALDSAINAIPDDEVSEQEFALLYANNPGSTELLNRLSAYYAAGRTVKAVYQAAQPVLAAMEPSIATATAAIDAMTGSLTDMAEQLGSGLGGSDTSGSMEQLAAGISSLAASYGTFHNGLVSYTAGVSELSGSYAGLHEGISEIENGTGALTGGLHGLQNGAETLGDAVRDIPEQIETEIEKFVADYDKSEFVPVSFVSEKNETVDSVQFVLKTQKIEAIAEPSEQAVQKEKETVWQRFLHLFR